MQIIGSAEKVIIPFFSRKKSLKAKIDSGADWSSIYATNISEDNGVLSFTLLNGKNKVILEKDYLKVKISSALGREERYLVKLSIVLSGKEHRAFFTLTDRSKSKYPVLIGKDLLNNNYLIDTAKQFILQ